MSTIHDKKHEGSDSSVAEKPTGDSSLLEQRRAALNEVNNAKFGWKHVRIVLIASIGFFTDAYDIFAINIASTMLGYVYGPGGKLTTNQELGIKVATPVGTLVGQLLFGWLADRIGRKRMYGVELMIIIVSCFAQSVSAQGGAVTITGVIIIWRFIMGVGIGGDYPLSAVISSEFAATRIRGRMMTATFAAQGFGNFTAALVALIVVAALKPNIVNGDLANPIAIDRAWRLLIGIGCIPAAIALYFRLTITETPRYTMDIERDVVKATRDIKQDGIVRLREVTRDSDEDLGVRTKATQIPKASWADFRHHFGQWKNLKILVGCAWSWFALDIAFYGLGLNSSIILQAIGFGKSPEKGSLGAWETLNNVCVGNLILSAAGLIPGYWATFLFIDSWGRRPIQFMGFIVLTVLFVIMGFGYDALIKTADTTKAFVFLYCLANFFQNFGPNTTTFVIPGEAFPTRYRSTAHGISAASGKLGAIVAQVGFAQLKDIGGTNKFVKHILEIFALFMLTGIFSTALIPETKGKTLEEISNEDF